MSNFRELIKSTAAPFAGKATRTERKLRRDLARFGKMLHANGFVAATDGNLSVRLDRDRVLVTPTCFSKGMMRPDVGAVVHAHPCTATGFASAGIALDEPLCSEIVITLGAVPLAPYATTGTTELSDSLRPFIPYHDAILMANHGVVTYGEDLCRAYMRMEAVEHYAKIVMTTRQLGTARSLGSRELEKLFEVRSQYSKTVTNGH